MLGQVVLLREMALVFHGHEMSFGAALAAWLLWAGIGSFSQKHESKSIHRFPFFLAVLVFCVPLSNMFIRFSKCLILPGNFPGLFVTLVLPFVALSVPGWFLGAVFANGAVLVRDRLGPSGPGKIYFYEGLGALVGGFASAGIYCFHVSSFLALSVCGCMLLVLAWSLFRHQKTRGLLLAAGLLLIGLSPCWETWSRHKQWRQYDLISQQETLYAHAALAKAGDTIMLFENGIVSLQFPATGAREEMVHGSLLSHKSPEAVLAIGWPAIAASEDILKHPVKTLDAVLLDQKMFGMIAPFLSGPLPPHRSAATVFFSDPRKWIKEHTETYDVILQSLPDPQTVAMNRFYTKEFFEEARQALKPGGLLAFSLSSSENYVPQAVRDINASVLHSLSQSFPFVEKIPGSRMQIWASDVPLKIGTAVLVRRFQERSLKTRVFIPQSFFYRLHPGRRQMLQSRLDELKEAAPNTDLQPVSIFLIWRVWLSKFASPVHFLGLTGILLALAFVLRKRGGFPALRSGISLILLAMGFVGMSFEVVLLHVFQAASGALYWHMGILLGAFMLGLSAGSGLASFCGERMDEWLWQKKNSRSVLMGLCVVLAALCGLVGFKISLLFALTNPVLVFGMLLTLAGFLVGAAFPVAAQINSGQAKVFYAADLWGAAAGALTAGAFVAPFMGYAGALMACSGILVSVIFIVKWFNKDMVNDKMESQKIRECSHDRASH